MKNSAEIAWANPARRFASGCSCAKHSTLKKIFGNELSARLLETQTTQALVRCAALNKMTYLGMPQSYKVV